MENSLILVLILIAGDHITPVNNEMITTEGELVTLRCSYDTRYENICCTFDTTDLSPYLFWYKQQPNGKPVFLQSKYTFGVKETVNEFKGRFHARLNVTAKSFPLTIQRLQLSDSAVYYCALKPTVTAGYSVPLQKL
uniref:Ig-like domain-containing protein n=1 Tax=Oncorhynchus tshawytscha TaxID=74940 RepID=A0A8C8J284_ONCTS